MFPDEWTSWDDFLGIRRTYDDGRNVARTLGIASELGWFSFAAERPAVLADLRLPRNPEQAYGVDFAGWAHWLEAA